MTDTLVSLSDVKAHLRIPAANTDDDALIVGSILPAVSDALINECGHTVPKQFDEFYDGGDLSIWLRNRPILSVELVSEGWGFTNYDLIYQQSNSFPAANLYAYSIDEPGEGVITRRSVGNAAVPFVRGDSNIHVVYTAGREEVPGAIAWAACELAAHMYQGALQRNPGTNNAFDTSAEDFTRSQGYSGINAGIPYRILEFIKAYRRTPIIG